MVNDFFSEARSFLTIQPFNRHTHLKLILEMQKADFWNELTKPQRGVIYQHRVQPCEWRTINLWMSEHLLLFGTVQLQ